MKRRLLPLLAAAVLLTAALPAHAHLDTLMQVLRPPKMIREYEADQCLDPAARDRIVDDAKATEGKAVRTEPGKPEFSMDFGRLEPGCYVVWVIGKVDAPDAVVEGELKVLDFQLDVTVDDETQTHGLRAAYTDAFHDLTHIYFNVGAAAHCRATLTVGERSMVAPIIDRIQLRDALDGVPLKAVKTKRSLYTDEEVARLRASAAGGKTPRPLRTEPMPADERAARDRAIWLGVVPVNSNYAGDQLYNGVGRDHGDHYRDASAKAQEKVGKPIGTWTFAEGQGYDKPLTAVNEALGLTYTRADYVANRRLPEPWPFEEGKGAAFLQKETWGTQRSFNFGIVPQLYRRRYHAVVKGIEQTAERYFLHEDTSAAEEAAFLLAAYAWRYPAYDFRAHCMANIYKDNPKRWQPGHLYGRGTGYEGWTTKTSIALCQAYDKLFPYIRNNEALAARIGRFVPWVKTPQDVVALFDAYLVRRAAHDGLTMRLYSPIIPWAAATLGPSKEADALLTQYFSRVYLRNTLCGFPDSIVNGYSRDGMNYIGSTFYVQGESVSELGDLTQVLSRYVRAGGDKRFDVDDPKRFPRLAALPEALLGLYTAGGYGSNIGDVADPAGYRRWYHNPKLFDPIYRRAWRNTNEPVYAWLLVKYYGQGDMTDAEWREVVAAAAEARDPLLHSTSGVLGGFGLVRMEEGTDSADFREKRSVTVRTGVASGHAHPDSLDIQVWAHGLRMLSDLGGRVSRKYGKPTCMSTYMHNVVEVDERSHGGGPVNSTGTAWVDAFKPMPGAQFTQASARAETHPKVDVYRRDVALIDVGETPESRTPGAYVFDVFRTRGGAVHTWSFKGCPPDDFDLNFDAPAATSDVAARYLAQHRPGSQREGTAPDPLVATWRLRREERDATIGETAVPLQNVERQMLRDDYDATAPRKYTRVRLFGHGGDRAMVANWYCTAFGKSRAYDWPFLHVRDESTADGSVWPSLIEPYAGEPFIASARPLEVNIADAPEALAPVAVEVKTVTGRTDVCYSSGLPEVVSPLEGDLTASGRFAFLSTDARGLVTAHLVGGTALAGKGVTVKATAGEYTGRIIAVDYANSTMAVQWGQAPPALAGQQVRVGNDDHTTNARIVSAAADTNGNTLLTFARTAQLYRGGVSAVDDEGRALLDLPPYLYDYHPRYYDGMTVVNEAGKVVGKARMQLGDRFAYLGWPEWHRHLQTMKPEDVTDANGDGRRTLTMVCADRVRYRTGDGEVAWREPGETMMDIEVTRVRDDGLMLWYKQHPMTYLDSLEKPHRGWPYHMQTLRNEAGTKEWTLKMPGDTYLVAVEDRALTMDDFPDTDGDGRRMLMLYDFGVGDGVSAPTHVYLRRNDAGGYDVRTDTQATVQLGDAEPVAITPDTRTIPAK